MGKFIITEEDKKEILSKYGVLTEGCSPGKNYTKSPSLDSILNGNSVMEYRHMGQDVVEVQNKLLSLNYDLGQCGADGNFGPKTKQAVEQFQQNSKLPVTSTVDKNTLNKLNNPDESSKNKSSNNSGQSGDVILMGGLDYRQGDLSIIQQVESLKNALGGMNVIGFRYTELNKVLQAVKDNPNAYVVLFSAGASNASAVSNVMTDKSKLFIVEPYAKSSNTAKSVQNAVANGTPASNVLVSPNNSSRGGGVVAGASSTPSGMGQWDALKYVSNLIS